jgi:hypothetical protein
MPLTDDDFNVAPAMFPSKKRKDTRLYAEPERSASLQQRGNSPLQRRSPTSQLSVAKDAPVVNTASVTPAKAAQANTYLSSLASKDLAMADQNKDLDETPGSDPEPVPPTNTTEVAIYEAMDDIVPYENDIQWYPAEALPGVRKDIIRMMGKKIFSHYTKAPMDQIFAIATLVNPEERVAVMYAGLKKKGQFVSDVQYDFEAVMPGYVAEAKVYRYKGLEFLLVKDFMGYYVYAWDKSSSLLSAGEDATAPKQLEKREQFFRAVFKKCR